MQIEIRIGNRARARDAGCVEKCDHCGHAISWDELNCPECGEAYRQPDEEKPGWETAGLKEIVLRPRFLYYGPMLVFTILALLTREQSFLPLFSISVAIIAAIVGLVLWYQSRRERPERNRRP